MLALCMAALDAAADEKDLVARRDDREDGEAATTAEPCCGESYDREKSPESKSSTALGLAVDDEECNGFFFLKPLLPPLVLLLSLLPR